MIFGFAMVTGGAYLLSRMGIGTSSATLVGYMIVMGLGIGIAMSTFTVIVQNQYPAHRLGEVSAGLQFFRSIGATVGLAVLGTILNNRFASSLTTSLPSELKTLATDPATAGQLNNPQVLLSAQAKTQLTHLFDQFGSQSQSLLKAFMEAVRHSLGFAISDVFLLATIVSARGLRGGALLAGGAAATYPRRGGGRGRPGPRTARRRLDRLPVSSGHLGR